jgi:hypothetical protein
VEGFVDSIVKVEIEMVEVRLRVRLRVRIRVVHLDFDVVDDHVPFLLVVLLATGGVDGVEERVRVRVV